MPELNEVVIISAARTPVGKFLGSLKGFSATELGAIVVRESVKRAGIKPEDVAEVIMGCVIQAGLGQNPARQAASQRGLARRILSEAGLNDAAHNDLVNIFGLHTRAFHRFAHHNRPQLRR